MSVYYCELSGDAITDKEEIAVVTPSGHVCSRRLILKKLSENGSVDPFGDGQPLTEDALIALRNVPSVVPPRSSGAGGGISGLLQSLKSEYDALVLELFDTRATLNDTRKELSHALYQNDAAVRVIARISKERDEAKTMLQQWNASGSGGGGGGGGGQLKAPPPAAAAPAAKKRKLDDEGAAAAAAAEEEEEGKIPAADLQLMTSTWEALHKGRKSALKKSAENAPTSEQLASFASKSGEKSWHKTSCKGIVAMSASTNADNDSLVLTAGTDRELVLYDNTTSKVMLQLNSRSSKLRKAITCLDLLCDKSKYYAAAGTTGGQFEIYSIDGEGESQMLELKNSDSGDYKMTTSVVDVRFHPDGSHAIVTSASGRLIFYRLDNDEVEAVAVFKPTEESKYTCGYLHPDGLIYLAGSEFGEVWIWDLKSQTQAGSLKVPDDSEEKSAVTAIEVSQNGYHIAVSHANSTVNVWDLRKQKLITTLNNSDGDNKLESVDCVAFDDSGKYLAYGGIGGVHVTTIKEWGITASYDTDNKKQPIHDVKWIRNGEENKQIIVASSRKQRDVIYFSADK